MVTFVNIGGEERPILFGNLAFQILLKRIEHIPDELGDQAKLYALIYGGLVCGYFAKQKSVNFTFDEVMQWIDNLSAESFVTIEKMITETTFYKTLIADYSGLHTALETEDGAKKK